MRNTRARYLILKHAIGKEVFKGIVVSSTINQMIRRRHPQSINSGKTIAA